MSTPNAASDIAPEPESVTLRRGVLGHSSLFAQSIAGVGPSIGAAAFFTLAFGITGNGTWVAVALAAIAIFATGVAVSYLARHHVSPGALYRFIPSGLRSAAAGFVLAPVVLTLGFCAGMITVLGFGFYGAEFLADVGIVHLVGAQLAYLDFPLIAVVTFLAYREIRTSTRVLLIIEILSIAAITILLLVVLFRHSGGVYNGAIVRASGATVHSIILGMVFFILAFGGFESAASLGLESRNPRRGVPLAVLGSVAIIALFFVFNAYVQPLGFSGTKLQLASEAYPLSSLASYYGVGWLGDIVMLGVAMSFLSAANAYLNYTSRMAHTIAHDGLLPNRLRRTSGSTGAPHLALFVIAGALTIATFVIVTTGGNQTNLFGYFSTIDGYAFTFIYLLISLAAVVVILRQLGKPMAVLVAGLIGITGMVAQFYYSLVPFPPYPASLSIIIFGAIVLAACIGYVVLRVTRPDIAARGLEVPTVATMPGTHAPQDLAEPSTDNAYPVALRQLP